MTTDQNMRFPWLNCPLCKGNGGTLHWGVSGFFDDGQTVMEPCYCDVGGNKYAKQIYRRMMMDAVDSYVAHCSKSPNNDHS